MPDYPDYLEPGRHRDGNGRRHQPWVRRAVLSLFFALAVLGLLNVFGQRSETHAAAGPAARMEVRGPTKVRGGLLFQERITIHTLAAVKTPRLVLDPGWADGLQINKIVPEASTEATRDGRIVLEYSPMSAGERLVVYIDYQANPTHVGTTNMSAEFDDRTVPLVRVGRTLTTFP